MGSGSLVGETTVDAGLVVFTGTGSLTVPVGTQPINRKKNVTRKAKLNFNMVRLLSRIVKLVFNAQQVLCTPINSMDTFAFHHLTGPHRLHAANYAMAMRSLCVCYANA